MRNFVAGAGTIASIQEHILDSLDYTFPDEQDRAAIEAAILAAGYEGWESRAINILKSTVTDSHDKLTQHIARIGAKFRSAVPHPGQAEDPTIAPQLNPHLRVYFCLKCGLRMTSFALKGLCCWGQPKCTRCAYEIHETGCKKTVKAKKSQPEKETT